MKLGIILADQLTHQLASLRALNRQNDILLLAEVVEEATYVAHHQQKIALLFSAMRHFAEELKEQGWRVIYHTFDRHSPRQSLLDVIAWCCGQCCSQHSVQDDPIDALVVTECGEYRLQHAIDQQWQETLGIRVECYQDDRFICSTDEFRHWASGRKQLRMEYFYREMRRKTGLLMEQDKPVGDQWNFDADNRKRYQGESHGDTPLPVRISHQRDQIDHDVIALVKQEFADHPGTLEHFYWATTRQQALNELDHFIQHRLPDFGTYQDAMKSGEHTLFHSLISPYLNCGLLTPLEVCQKAEQAYINQQAPLNAVEGFIRQIIGWREYVRGIYWLWMPDYGELNILQNHRPLPDFYWHGNTRMHCMSECFKNTFQHAYAHHIQRLMVTGNFALLSGITPQQVGEWYLAVYADAYEWVELPNTHGMVMFADGGRLGSKPYAASGNYINKMSDYCKHCDYNVKTATDDNSCPFNSLYWHFIQRHQPQFSNNPRMTMVYRNWQKMNPQKQQALINRAEYLLANLNDL
ncbi:cryptochrome/photolyase family protein [Bacterioplanoides sp.]|uniref:cryptochrome/photolyase family protein n=1 Tax=Bacterioplanoides sp. TaxID=2066072 RepID=UPI003B006998